MDFRRIPFQFSSTDPAKRQAELQKRFGLPVNTNRDKMHIDFENPGLMGFNPREKTSTSNSPRLQHRVPVFVEGDPEPMMSSVEGSPVPGRKPHVRVIPIEMEGDDLLTKRHRNLSSPANTIADRPSENGSTWLPEEFAPYVRPPVIDPKPKPPTMPRERTIPIQVEGIQNKKAKTAPVQKPKSVNQKKETGSKHSCQVPKVEKQVTEEKKSLSGPALSLKKIEGVLERLKGYHSDVEKFSGTVKEKQYRYLDEMLTRLMLELDNIDTMGNEEVRLSRKAAVKQVQASVDLLEAKVTRETSEEMPVENNPVDTQAEVEQRQDMEMQMPTSQEENMSKEGGTVPVVDNEDSSKFPTKTAPVTELPIEIKVDEVEVETKIQAGLAPDAEEHVEEKVEDVEMESCGLEGEEIKKEALEEMSEAAGENFQVMEVDENVECDPTPEPVVTTVDSPIAGVEICESREVSNIPIELVNGETSEVKDTEQEPVVTLAESPVKKIEIVNADVPNEETCKLETVTEVLPEKDSACAEITLSSQGDACEDYSKLEPNTSETSKHSELTVSKHSSEVLDNEVLSS